MNVLNDRPPTPPPPPRMTTLGELARDSYKSAYEYLKYDQLITLIFPRHAFLLDHKTKTAYPVWQRAWIRCPENDMIGVVAVINNSEAEDDTPRMVNLIPDGRRPCNTFKCGDLELSTEDVTPPHKSLQYLAAKCIAKNWEGYTREEQERIWDKTLLVNNWCIMK